MFAIFENNNLLQIKDVFDTGLMINHITKNFGKTPKQNIYFLKSNYQKDFND